MNKLKTKTVQLIDDHDWDELVVKTYGKPYCFQQQEDCRERGTFALSVPSEYTDEDQMSDEIPININGSEMGVKFDVWLNRTEPFFEDELEEDLFWHRNFYPSIYTLANDLHSKGLLDEGNYLIKIDW